MLLPAKNLALYAKQNEVAQAVAVFGGGFEDVPDMGAIGDFQFPTERVDEELLDEAAGEGGLAFQERCFELDDVFECLAAEVASGVDGDVLSADLIMPPPAADGAEALQGESRWVYVGVA